MNLKRFAVSLGLVTFILTSCSKDDEVSVPLPKGDYESGILVSHEGNYLGGNASVSFVSYDFGTVENNVFNLNNNKLLGDTAQSIAFNSDLAYIIVNGSNKIEIVNRYTFKSVATISSGLNNPRYIAFANGKGYVTNWSDAGNATDDYLAIINLASNTLQSTTIAVEEGPENIVSIGNKVYVAHQGGWSQNNKVSVIDTTSDTVSTVITVGDVPNSMQEDDLGNLWVLCGGKPSWTGSETLGQLFKINTTTNTTTSLDFALTEHPSKLLLENGNLYYYMSGAVYKMSSTATVLPTTTEITGLSFYGMSIKDDVLYGVDAGDFSSNGTLVSYSLATNTLINSAIVNIIPNAVFFN